MENNSHHKDMRGTALFIDFKWLHDHICVWPWEDAPDFVKAWSTNAGDEDGVVWIPLRFLDQEEVFYIRHSIEGLWNHEQDVDKIRFSDGMLVIWAHS